MKKPQIEEVSQENWEESDYYDEIPNKRKAKAIGCKSNSDEFS